MHWSYPSGSTGLYLAIAITLVAGFGLMFAFMSVPPAWRRPIVFTATFLSGVVYVAYYLVPKPIPSHPGMFDSTSDFLKSAQGPAGDIAQAVTTFLLGLGIYSLVHIHGKRFLKQNKDWGFSLILLICMLLMVIFGYVNYYQTKLSPDAPRLTAYSNWGFFNYGNDLLFDGLLQQMDAAMFSIISFYILSAAYRAFRVRSVEATILLASAIIVILSLMPFIDNLWAQGVHGLHLSDNFTLSSMSQWLRDTFQNSGLRALDFGIGLGALAMGLRLWLSLERGGISA